jgi:ABC-type dipeptide/oligopeptide/nickel transport system permease component
MVNYILRRVLFMFPTIIGITFVVFMLIALSPGGIGAGLLVSGGGAMQSQNAIAIQKAKLEDRYGLNEPAVVQYFRWLARISPIKFGQRDLVSPSGELVSKPREIPEPPAWQWLTSSLPEPKVPTAEQIATQFPAGDEAARAQAFRTLESRYVAARAEAIATDALLRDALKRHAEEIGRLDLITRSGEPKLKQIASLTPDKTKPSYAEIEKIGQAAIASYSGAVDQRELLVAAMRTKPYPEAGFGIIPGVLSVAPPDLGVAFSRGRPVIDLISAALPVTLLLNLIAFPIIYLVAIPGGMLAATRRGSFADVGLGAAFIALYSIPTVLAGVLLQGFFANPDYFNAFPTAGLHGKGSEDMTFLPSGAGATWSPGWLMDHLWHMVLPVLCLVYGGFAVLSKQTRAAMLENFNADYVRTAKAKGVAPRDVVLRHVFRNSLLPLITMFVTIFPAMLAGSVVVERIFSVPGMGSLLIEAINLRDRELILANTTMVALVNLAALLLADILYAMADPRITYK